MGDDLFTGPSVDLETVLGAREARVARRLKLFLTRRRPVVSLTVVMPGPVKDNRAARTLRDAALAALTERLALLNVAAEIAHLGNGPAGPEALVSVDLDAVALKRETVALEDTHPLGRLWDLDVIDPVAGGLSRRDLAHPPRRCLICDEPAHACARSRAHTPEELLARIEEMIDASRLANRA